MVKKSRNYGSAWFFLLLPAMYAAAAFGQDGLAKLLAIAWLVVLAVGLISNYSKQ
jgi:hypothetical protein